MPNDLALNRRTS